MTSQALERMALEDKRRKLMHYFIVTGYLFVKKDVAELTVEEAQHRWAIVKENFLGVCFRAGVGRRSDRDAWTGLMRKMVLLRDKAAEQPKEGDPHD